jgi:hypothetical protein
MVEASSDGVVAAVGGRSQVAVFVAAFVVGHFGKD